MAIYQAESRRLAEQPLFAYLPQRLTEFRKMWRDVLKAGVADGSFRPDLDIELSYRFLRDTVWVGVGWYRPGGKLDIDDIARQYLAIVLDGIAATTKRSTPCLRPTSSTSSAPRSGAVTAGWRRCTLPTSVRT